MVDHVLPCSLKCLPPAVSDDGVRKPHLDAGNKGWVGPEAQAYSDAQLILEPHLPAPLFHFVKFLSGEHDKVGSLGDARSQVCELMRRKCAKLAETVFEEHIERSAGR
jgi:hypothetical protein